MNRTGSVNAGPAIVGGLGVGAALMYLLDPEEGRRRRALVRNKLSHALNVSSDAAGTTARDLANRAQGLAAEIESKVTGRPVSDPALEQRVRSRLGWAVSHPGAIEVTARRGVIELRGPVLEQQVGGLLEIAAKTRGVKAVENHLEVHKTAADIPALQGSGRPREPRAEFLQDYWSPTARLMAGTAGGALTAYAVARRDPVSVGLGALGLGLLARGLTNMPFRRMIGVGAGRRAVDFHKTINVNAPLERVFEFWTRYDKFPTFMSHLKKVEMRGDTRSHWVARGPAGTPVEWDAEITRIEPNRILAWKSLSGSPIENAGIIHFDRNPNGTTRVDIRMSYNPPAGAVGHVIAAMFGVDPKRAMDEDMVRFKSIIEAGKTTAHGERVSRKEPAARPG